MSTPSTADVIAADGVAIPLLDLTTGQTFTAHMRYSMQSLRVIEAEHGSVMAVAAGFDKLKGGAPEDLGPVFTTLIDVVAPGLLHVRSVNPDTGQTVRLGKSPELVGEMMIPGALQTYVQAFLAALQQSFGALMGPTVPDAATSQPDPPAAPFPGMAGTTSPPSRSDVPSASSGT